MNTAQSITPPGGGISGISLELLKQAKTMKVLVVDDSRTLRRLLIRELNIMGITDISEAGDGNEALVRLREKTPDLMLLDMEMPELDGLGVLKVVKSSSELNYLPIIMVSSAEQFEKTVECIQLGADDYLGHFYKSCLKPAIRL